ncbi:uncharacterized protein LOC114345184 isoform X2 [Diabrotica virgifera virgifera]|uniref:Uncharacterized protein LOC114345184 isoform X2 n=1 Tax=Diabrotica virgifera virgifera TaxID=50390 RepID=A0A6P7H059_DIAVI|nr:uncharacterized protein LOC114345184 isoform X2 [Diabrotica virgifera virgifera]
MEISQVNEQLCKIETTNHEVGETLLDTFKIEITEEPKRESVYDDAFGYFDLKELPVKTEIEQNEYKFSLFEEKEANKERNGKHESNGPGFKKEEDSPPPSPINGMECLLEETYTESHRITHKENQSITKEAKKGKKRVLQVQIVKMETTIDTSTPTASKRKRLKNYCYFCENLVFNFSRHLKTAHSSEVEVQEMLSKPIQSKERKELIGLIRKKGNYLNSHVYFKPMKKTNVPCDRDNYIPCEFCLGLYVSSQLRRHKKVCPKRLNKSKTIKSKVKVNNELQEKVFPTMEQNIQQSVTAVNRDQIVKIEPSMSRSTSIIKSKVGVNNKLQKVFPTKEQNIQQSATAVNRNQIVEMEPSISTSTSIIKSKVGGNNKLQEKVFPIMEQNIQQSAAVVNRDQLVEMEPSVSTSTSIIKSKVGVNNKLHKVFPTKEQNIQQLVAAVNRNQIVEMEPSISTSTSIIKSTVGVNNKLQEKVFPTKEQNIQQSAAAVNRNQIVEMEPRISTSSTSTASKQKLKNYCYFCENLVLNFSRHLKNSHSSEVEVKEMLSKPTKSKERKELIGLIRKKGNYLNWHVHFKPMKKTNIPCGQDHYIPCEFCLGLYLRRQLWRHKKVCPKRLSKSKSKLIVNNELQEKVFPSMRLDEVSIVAKKDALICAFGARYLKKHREKYHINVTSRKMRELAKILIEVRKIEPTVQTLLEALNPRFYDHLVKATKIIAGYDSTKKIFESPTFVINITITLKQSCDIAITNGLKKKDIYGNVTTVEVQKDLETMRRLLQYKWKSDISKEAIIPIWQ